MTEKEINLVQVFNKETKANEKYLGDKYGWSKNDTRIAVFAKCCNATEPIILSMVFTFKQLQDQKWWDWFSLGLSLDDRSIMKEQYERFLISSFINSNFSAVESSLRTIIKNVYPGSCSNGTAEFESIYKAILANLNLKCHENIFKLMRLIRNTIHNNFLYFHKSGLGDSVTFDGKTYNFEIGKPVGPFNWDFLVYLHKEFLKAVLEIIEHKDVSLVKEITDPWAYIVPLIK